MRCFSSTFYIDFPAVYCLLEFKARKGAVLQRNLRHSVGHDIVSGLVHIGAERHVRPEAHVFPGKVASPDIVEPLVNVQHLRQQNQWRERYPDVRDIPTYLDQTVPVEEIPSAASGKHYPLRSPCFVDAPEGEGPVF